MRIRTEAKTLADALTRVKPAVGKSSITALTGVLIEAEGDRIHLTTTNMGMAIRQRLDGEVGANLHALVPHADLAKAAKALNGRTVELDLEESKLTVIGGKRRLTLPTLPLADYPDVGDFDEGELLVKGDGDTLAAYIDKAVVYAGKDETRPMLVAALLEIGEAKLSSEGSEILPAGARFIATDSFRLGLVPAPKIQAVAPPGSFTRISREALVTAAKLMKKASVVEIHAELLTPENDGAKQRTVIDMGETQITTTHEGRFPNWRQLVPDESAFNIEAQLPRAALIEATGVAKQIANRNAPARLTLNGSVRLEVMNTPDQPSVEEEIEGATMKILGVDPPQVAGEPFVIALSPDFLHDLAKQIDGDTIRMRAISPSRPAYFEGETERVLLMPIRLNI